MTKFVIPLRRILPADLVKGFSRGNPAASHKYVRRQRVFMNGKLAWRYFYLDDVERQRGREQHDPESKHEHHLVSALKELHPNLKAKAVLAAEATVEYIKGLFGWGGEQPSKVKVESSGTWHEKYQVPYLNRTDEDIETLRSPQARVAKGVDLLPDHIKELVGLKHKKGAKVGAGVTTVTLTDFDEDEKDLKDRGIRAAGWYRPLTGDLHITSLANAVPFGGEYFRSPLTWTEVVVTHEVGHAVHYEIQYRRPEQFAEWEKLYSQGNRISEYAGTNHYEDFAESFACALTHPKQLAKECPERYDFMRKYVLPELKSREAILDTPDEDLAWWKAGKATPATKVLNRARQDFPAKRHAAYYSDKDQFYSLAKDGRQVYLRMGPPDKQSEDGWERMPATIDPQTGLPRYEGGLYNRFRADAAIKEIYDQDGKPLDDRQAYFYLGQDDEKVQELIEKHLDADPKTAVEKLYDQKTWSAQRGSLGRAIFDALGGNLFNAGDLTEEQIKDPAHRHKIAGTLEYERARVAKARAKGETGQLARHEWVPVEVSPREFLEKSGTFKFGDLVEAPDSKQTAMLRDPENGATLTYYDPAAGKFRPQLSARLYEQQNPDGTWTKIRIHEESGFQRGESILVPQKFVRVSLDDGDKVFREADWAARRHEYPDKATEHFTQWSKHTLTEADSSDPEVLARAFGTTARTLLERNNRYGRGQIMDPVLATLLNPGGRKQVRSAADLQGLMREAAESDPPRRAWVSIAGASAHGVGRAVGHIQVEWDGAGPPKVVGDYWARRLGKTTVRLDELLDKSDEIRLPRIVEKKGLGQKKANLTSGSVVWIKEPKSGRRIMATFVATKFTDDGVRYEVQALPGQGSGIPKTLITVDDIQARRLSEIPNVGKLGRERRFMEPLDSDVLLYADETAVGSGPNDTSGVVRIKLPKDGSISYEMLQGMPGVQTNITPDADQLGHDIPPIGIAVADIPKFRERIGGFVMDSRVRAMLDQAMQQEREIRERLEGAEVVTDTDIVDDKGNINPDGVLRGLVTGDEGIQPGSHRIKALKKLAKNGGRLMAAHFMGTGKTAFAIMASQMMRNLKDNDGNPHPSQTKGKTLIVVPLNTAENWYQEFKKFAGAPPTLVGASTLAGAQQLPKLPEQGDRESADAYKKRVLGFWEEHLKNSPSTWNPFTDNNTNVVISYEYFRENEAALRVTGLFDGMVVDEAHKIANENEVSRAIERWNSSMKLFLPMTGTPITNTLSTLPRIMRLVSGGQVDLGDEKAFVDNYLIESAVQKALGAKSPPKTDLNPNKVGELMSKIQPYLDVANTTDVKGQNMPAVLLDENAPSHMTGQQATMYRAAMAKLTPADRAALESSAALGLDETKMLGDSARRKVAVARSIANCPAYKAPDLREELQYEATVATKNEKRGTVEKRLQNRAFRLPDHETVLSKGPDGWNGRWPSEKDVQAGRIQQGYLNALFEHSYYLFGVDYASLAGKKLTPALLSGIKGGEYVTDTGQPWAGKVANPDYGPEGMISRGVLDPTDGEIKPITYQWSDEHGDYHQDIVPTGTVFVRDPNRKAAGLFYHRDDWDFTGRFEDSGEGGDEGGEDEGSAASALRDAGWEDHPVDKGLIWNPETEETQSKPAGWTKRTARNQGPKAGRESLSIQRSVSRRRERAMFDATVTTNNAKADAMEAWIKNVVNDVSGDPKGDLTQFIHFGNRVGSSVRTMEAKLRTMGFQDVNEALGHANVSGPADRALVPRKYFVTYMGKGATLGDRNINSEIFRRKQDKFGKDMGISMFVWRTLYGGTGKQPKLGEIKEGWSPTERKSIADNFRDDTGRQHKDGTPAGLEVPMRVIGAPGPNNTVVPNYAYESDMKSKDRSRLKQLDVLLRGATGDKAKALETEQRELLKPYWTDRMPISDFQMHVFNNTQHMVASDAANVGLNWPASYLGMYDSLFSPMDEWQRITRAARMLPPATSREAAPIVAKIDTWIQAREANLNKDILHYTHTTALATINEALDALPAEDLKALQDLGEGSPDQLIEAYFAKRSLERIQGLRESAESTLRREGYWPDPVRRNALEAQRDAATDDVERARLSAQIAGMYIPPAAIQASDVTNFIIDQKMSHFERAMMRDRRFLVHVKRFTTSVDVPEFRKVVVSDPLTGKKSTVEVPTGEYVVESPSQAERAQLAQQRAKMVPYERFMNDVQNATPQPTAFDFLPANSNSMASTSTTDKKAEVLNEEHAEDAMDPAYAAELAAPAPTTRPSEYDGPAEGGSLHERVARTLGWKVADTKSFDLRSLRELVRPLSQKLVTEITEYDRSGRVVVDYEGPRIPLKDAPDAPTYKSEKPVFFVRLGGR